MKKQIIFLVITVISGIASFFKMEFNFIMTAGVMLSTFHFAQSLSKPKELDGSVSTPSERALGPFMFMCLVACSILFAVSGIKAFFFIWEFLSKGSYEKIIYALMTICILIAPFVIGYYFGKFFAKTRTISFSSAS